MIHMMKQPQRLDHGKVVLLSNHFGCFFRLSFGSYPPLGVDWRVQDAPSNNISTNHFAILQ